MSGNSKLGRLGGVPACPCSPGMGTVILPGLEEALLTLGLEGTGMGEVKLLLGSCFWVNWASALPDPAGLPRKMDPKTAHVGFLPVFLVQHPVGSPGGPTASTRERVSVGSCLLWILPGVPALVWEINDS